MWIDKLSSFLIDVAKYLNTGGFFASLLKDLEGSRVVVYAVCGVIGVGCLILGLMVSNLKKKD